MENKKLDEHYGLTTGLTLPGLTLVGDIATFLDNHSSTKVLSIGPDRLVVERYGEKFTIDVEKLEHGL